MSGMRPDPARDALRTGIARIAALLAGEDGESHEAELVAGAPLPRLAASFGLTPFERDLLLLAAAHQLDPAVAAAIAIRPEAASGGRPSFALAQAVLTGAHWSAIGPGRPLRRWQLLLPEADAPLVSAALVLDERVLHHLAGTDHLDHRLAGIAALDTAPPGALAAAHRAAAKRLATALHEAAADPPGLFLSGDDPEGMLDTARAIAAGFGMALLTVDADQLPGDPAQRERLAVLIEREATLSGALVLLRAEDAIGPAARRLADRLQTPFLVAARQAEALDRTVLRAEIDLPSPAERAELWRAALGDDRAAEADALALRHRIGARAVARHAAAGDAASLRDACRLTGRARLDALAQRVSDGAALDDLVLPAAERTQLDAIVAQMRARAQVELGWGARTQGGRGLGVTALFAGESGTGKTMAAEAIARALDIDLYRIDLAGTVSKYLGETEKNLRRLFDAAEDAGAALLFDEADTLFGKRGEVRDARDRYANLEVGYLLQRLEQFAGLAILTTNLRSAIDPAFLRRLRFVVSFPFPDEAARAEIWRRALPPLMPSGALDPTRLARLAVSGGAIRTIALNGAFIAADAGRPPEMGDMLAAARAEATKRERPLSDAETRGWG